jgi:hypothetical protein
LRIAALAHFDLVGENLNLPQGESRRRQALILLFLVRCAKPVRRSRINLRHLPGIELQAGCSRKPVRANMEA